MAVESFDPSNLAAEPNPETVGVLRELAARTEARCGMATTLADFELSDAQVQQATPLARSKTWAQVMADAPMEEVLGLIRLFTLGEMAHGSWTAGEASPVPALVRILKNRGEFNKELGQWIKDHTTNRFLPHGNLMDRL